MWVGSGAGEREERRKKGGEEDGRKNNMLQDYHLNRAKQTRDEERRHVIETPSHISPPTALQDYNTWWQ
jgi:hypothetical protein